MGGRSTGQQRVNRWEAGPVQPREELLVFSFWFVLSLFTLVQILRTLDSESQAPIFPYHLLLLLLLLSYNCFFTDHLLCAKVSTDMRWYRYSYLTP